MQQCKFCLAFLDSSNAINSSNDSDLQNMYILFFFSSTKILCMRYYCGIIDMKCLQ